MLSADSFLTIDPYPYGIRIESKQHVRAWCRAETLANTFMHVFTSVDLCIQFCNERKQQKMKDIHSCTLPQQIGGNVVMKATDVENAVLGLSLGLF